MKRFAVLVSVAVLGVASSPSDAEACGRFKEFRQPKVNEKLRDVRRSEHLLAQGKFDKAAKLARKAFPKVTKLPASEKDQALFHRANASPRWRPCARAAR